MPRQSLANLHKRLTRSTLERRLGGEFKGIRGSHDHARSNGQWNTYIIMDGGHRRLKCAARDGRVYTALTWHDLGRQMGIMR